MPKWCDTIQRMHSIRQKKQRILLYSSNLWYLGQGMFGPLLAVFAQRVGGNILDVAWAWAIYSLVTGALQIVVGYIADRRNREKIMILGYALNALCTFGYLVVSTPMELFMIQVGLGVAMALATPTWSALYHDNSSSDQNGFLWGLAHGQAQIAIGVAMLIGGLIVSRYSFTTLFLVMGVVQTIATLYQIKILKA